MTTKWLKSKNKSISKLLSSPGCRDTSSARGRRCFTQFGFVACLVTFYNRLERSPMLRPSYRVLFLGLFFFLLVRLIKPVFSGPFPYDGFLPGKSSGVFGAVACLESKLNPNRGSGVRKQGLEERWHLGGESCGNGKKKTQTKTNTRYALVLNSRVKHGSGVFSNTNLPGQGFQL